MSLETTTTDSGAHGRGHRENPFGGERHVYEPHRVGLPPIGAYVRELWRRRSFAVELSRTKLRAQQYNTVFGQAWLIINPMLLAAVYFILVDILRSGSRGADFFAHLVACLFAYSFVQQSAGQAVKSVVSGGKLILNSAFPRMLLPLSAVVTGFKRFLPTMVIFIPVHVITDLPVGPELLWVIPLTGILILLAAGLSVFVAAAQVYFRDLKSFLPYALRMWLYVSPILYFADEVPARYEFLLWINPLGQLLSAWNDVLIRSQAPTAEAVLVSLAWAGGIFVLSALFFMSREREFAVRL